MKITALELYLIGGEVFYHLGIPAIFFNLGVFVKC